MFNYNGHSANKNSQLLKGCHKGMKGWMTSNFKLLNPSKTNIAVLRPEYLNNKTTTETYNCFGW